MAWLELKTDVLSRTQRSLVASADSDVKDLPRPMVSSIVNITQASIMARLELGAGVLSRTRRGQAASADLNVDNLPRPMVSSIAKATPVKGMAHPLASGDVWMTARLQAGLRGASMAKNV
jgi:hypothetical protein